VNVRAADAASVDSDIDIIVFEGLEFELYRRQWCSSEWQLSQTDFFFTESRPVFRISNGKASRGFWIRHYGIFD
jgi:hypothetical protein